MKNMQEMNKCPNCEGKMKKVAGNRYTCPFCGSEFEFDDEQNDSADAPEKKKESSGDEFSKTDWFDFNVTYKELLKGPDSKKVMSSFVHCLNECGTVESILAYIQKVGVKCRGLGMPGYHEDMMEKYAKRVKKLLDPNEKLLLFINTAVFSDGKHGILLTDRQTIMDTKKLSQIAHTDIVSLQFDMDEDSPDIYINNERRLKLMRISDTERPLGALVALICALSFEQKPGRDRIAVYGPEDYDDEDYDEEDPELEEEDEEEEE